MDIEVKKCFRRDLVCLGRERKPLCVCEYLTKRQRHDGWDEVCEACFFVPPYIVQTKQSVDSPNRLSHMATGPEWIMRSLNH